MPRYIDADAVEETIDKCVMFGNTALVDKYEVLGRLRNIPTADVVPVKHGKWLLRETLFEETEAKCSVCGFETLVNEPGNGLHIVDDLKYCPSCGARMEESDDADT